MSLIPNDDMIDKFILVQVQPRNLKVAMVVAKVDDALVTAGFASDLQRIGARIETLAALGRIKSFGVLHNWRHSEVCQNEQ